MSLWSWLGLADAKMMEELNLEIAKLRGQNDGLASGQRKWIESELDKSYRGISEQLQQISASVPAATHIADAVKPYIEAAVQDVKSAQEKSDKLISDNTISMKEQVAETEKLLTDRIELLQKTHEQFENKRELDSNEQTKTLQNDVYAVSAEIRKCVLSSQEVLAKRLEEATEKSCKGILSLGEKLSAMSERIGELEKVTGQLHDYCSKDSDKKEHLLKDLYEKQRGLLNEAIRSNKELERDVDNLWEGMKLLLVNDLMEQGNN